MPEPPSEDLAARAKAIVGDGGARPATPADAIARTTPRLVVTPDDGQRLADVLAWAGREKLAVVVRGGGTKIGWSGRPSRADVLLSTDRLNRDIEHRHGDLTVTVQAGVTLDALNQTLARHGQWLPLDPAWSERATIGGVLATNDAGPRRFRFGAPRDLVIGVELARPDGHTAKAGGIVVKNVAGYDLGKLLAGSFGSLAVILSASFKLAPVLPASCTLVIDTPSLGTLGTMLLTLAASQMGLTALESHVPPPRLLVRLESTPDALEPQADQIVKVARELGGTVTRLEGDDEAELWTDHRSRIWSGPGSVVKLSLLPAALAGALEWLTKETASRGVDLEASGLAGLGLQLVRLDGPTDAQAAIVSALRERQAPGAGSAVVLRSSPVLDAQIDRWGDLGEAIGVMRAIKQRFDPAGVLNPGLGPGGL